MARKRKQKRSKKMRSNFGLPAADHAREAEQIVAGMAEEVRGIQNAIASGQCRLALQTLFGSERRIARAVTNIQASRDSAGDRMSTEAMNLSPKVAAVERTLAQILREFDHRCLRTQAAKARTEQDDDWKKDVTWWK